jgi:polyisoprenoid-binding protein YceI
VSSPWATVPRPPRVEASVKSASITTNNDMRDGHLKSGDFLEEEKYPTIEFASTKLTPKGDKLLSW